MELEVGDRHLAGQDEGNGPGQEADEDAGAAAHLEKAPIQTWDMTGAVPPAGGIPAGKAKSFIEPSVMNIEAATMRSTF